MDNGFPAGDRAELFLVLDTENKLDFAGASDRGGGFIEPSVAVNALSRIQGAVGDAGKTAGGIQDGNFKPEAFLGGALPKLFGLFDLKAILVATGLGEAPKLIADQLDFIGSVGADYANLKSALEKARATLDLDIATTTTAGAKQRLEELRVKVQQALDTLAANPVAPLIAALQQGPPNDGDNPAAGPARQIFDALDTMESLRTNAFLPAYLRALIERPLRALEDRGGNRAERRAIGYRAALGAGIVDHPLRVEPTDQGVAGRGRRQAGVRSQGAGPGAGAGRRNPDQQDR